MMLPAGSLTAGSLPTGERGLKSSEEAAENGTLESLPTGERGLKC